MNQLILTATVFAFTLVFLSTGFEYWQSRKKGMSHDASVHDATVAGGFLSGSAVFSYLVTMLT